MRSVDVHQHLWPEAVLRVLERRGVPPKATWRSDRWHVELPTEPGFDVHPSDHDPAERARSSRSRRPPASTRCPHATPWLSSPPGRKPSGRCRPSWAGGPLHPGPCRRTPRPSWRARRSRTARRVCACRPPRLSGAERTLAAVADAGAPVLIHPGPAVGGRATDPAWWSPATDYEVAGDGALLRHPRPAETRLEAAA